MNTRLDSRLRDDEGAILIIALVITTAIALVTGALLTFGGNSFLATVQLRQVANKGYAGDAAVQTAINDLELGQNAVDPGAQYPSTPNGWVYDNNIDGTGCFGLNGDGTPRTQITLPNVNSSTGPSSATVTCAPVPGTGIFGTSPGNDNNGTGRAVTILGPNGVDINPQGTGNGAAFQIHGDLASAGPLTVAHGFLQTTGTVTAHGCPADSAVQADGPCTDSGGSVSDPFATRTADISAVPTTLGSWSGCTFQPGYYDDANALTNATSACNKSVFAPGDYYFDFHNNSSDPTYSSYAMSGGSSDVWTISKTVIGGDISGGTNSIPGMCKNPIDSTGNAGVQFVFGGDSQVSLGMNANVELCAAYVANAEPIAIFGLDGSTGRGALSPGYQSGLQQTPSVTAGTVVSSKAGGQPDFKPSPASLSDQAALATEDGKSENFSQTSGNSTPALTLGGFSPATAIPAGSLLTGAKVAVTHSESTSGTTGSPTIAPKLTVSVGSATNVNLTGLTNTSGSATPNVLARDTIDLTSNSAVMTALAGAVHAGDISGFSASFSENAKGKTNASVDFFQLQLTYYTPTLRGQTSTAVPGNCITARTCDVITTGNGSSFKGAFVVQGVTYVPSGSVSLALGNQTAVVALRWGLVADHATLGSLNQFPFAYPVVSIPSQGPGLGAAVTGVDLRVFLCTLSSGQTSCPTGGTPALTSRVRITDKALTSNPLQVDPAPGKRKIDVMSYSEQR